MTEPAATERDPEPAAPAPFDDADEPATLGAMLREYATTDPRSLGLFRIVFGIFLLVDLYRRLPDYVLFYTNEGVLPNHAAIFRPMSNHLFSLYHAFSTRGEVLAAFAATAVAYAFYTVGYKTRLWQFVVLVLVTSLHSRNILLENGGDVVANLLALWTCFLPVGRRFSIDAMLESLKMRREGSADELNDRSSPKDDARPITSLAYAAAVLNLAVIYYFNVVHKDGFAWKNATSVHYVLWADRLVQPLGVALRPIVPLFAIKVMTLGTLILESSITVLLVSPIYVRSCRRVAAFLIIALHCGFQTLGHFGLFSFAMMLHAPLLLGPGDWEALARRMRAKLPRRVVFYDASCGVCHQIARVAKRLDPLGKLSFVPNDDEEALPSGVGPEIVKDTVVVTDASKTRVWTRNDAVAQGLRAIPYGVALARLAELPGVRSLARAGYDFVASRRVAISEAMGYAACGVPQRFGGETTYVPKWDRPPLLGRWNGRIREAIVVVFMIALGSEVLAENRRVPSWAKPTKQPEVLAAIAQYPRFFQGWSMFAPVPPSDDGKIVVDAVTVSGKHVDPLTFEAPDFTMPPANRGMLVTQFWYELHDRMRRDVNARYRDYMRDYFANWNTVEHRPPGDRIVAFEAYWVWHTTLPPGSYGRGEVSRVRFMEWHAPDAPPSVVPPPMPAPSESAPTTFPVIAPAASR